jgi:hypothetical protein
LELAFCNGNGRPLHLQYSSTGFFKTLLLVASSALPSSVKVMVSGADVSEKATTKSKGNKNKQGRF